MAYPGGNDSEKKKRKRKRLKDIQSFEVAGVPRGAVGRRFVITKEDGSMSLDLSKLTKVHGTIGKIITVCKSGTPSPETVETLGKDLQEVQTALHAMLGGTENFDPVGIKTRIEDIKGLASSLAESTHDLNMQDQLDTLLEKVKEISAQVEKISVAPQQASADPPAADPPAAPAADADPPAADPPAADPPAADPPADPPKAPAAPEPSAEGGDNPPAADPPAADPPAADPPAEGTSEVVTKADLKTFGDGIIAGMKEAFGTLATTLKSAQPAATNARGLLIPPAGGGDPNGPASSATQDQNDETHWGNKYDLNSEN